MSIIEFIWDERKAATNLKKHGVSFQEARSVFYDENARHMADTAHSREEDRFVLLGMSAKLRLIIVCHCFREADSIIRIISAWKASKQEQSYYLEAL